MEPIDYVQLEVERLIASDGIEGALIYNKFALLTALDLDLPIEFIVHLKSVREELKKYESTNSNTRITSKS